MWLQGINFCKHIGCQYIPTNNDSIANNQQRFEAVADLTKKLAGTDLQKLHEIYQDLEPEIKHNSHVFQTGIAYRLQSVVDRINHKL